MANCRFLVFILCVIGGCAQSTRFKPTEDGSVTDLEMISQVDLSMVPDLSPSCVAHSLVFNGVDSYASIPFSSGINLAGTDFTVDLWVKLASYAASQNRISLLDLGAAYAGTDSRAWEVYIDSITHQFGFHEGGGANPQSDVPGNLAVPLHAWTHLAATFGVADQAVSLWVGGRAAGSGKFSFPILTGNAHYPLVMGRDSVESVYFMNGALSEVRLSSNVRYMAPFSPSPCFSTDASTVALWHFDEAAGNMISDATGKSSAGSLIDVTRSMDAP